MRFAKPWWMIRLTEDQVASASGRASMGTRGCAPSCPRSSRMVLFLTGVACLAPVLAPSDPFSLGDMALSEPSPLHLMGTDHLGRDILSAVLWGLRVSLLVGVCAALIAVVLGVCIGGPAGYFGAQLDSLLMRATDAVMVLPTFFLVLIVVAIFGGSIWKLIALIGITNWPPVARLVRAEFLSLRGVSGILPLRRRRSVPAML
jgi:peptide/nickel transport system permease protein